MFISFLELLVQIEVELLEKNIEKAYSRHYSWNQSSQKKRIAINNALPEQEGTVDQGHSRPIEK